MSAERRAYLDTSALAKWYLNEANSDAFVGYLQGLDIAVISSLTRVEMRSLLSRRRRTGELTLELESLLFAAFVEDLDRGWLQLYPVGDDRFNEAVNLINRYPEHPLRTLDALHLAVAVQAGIEMLATADTVIADAAIAMGFEVARF
jgi:uncharacterized protein